MIYSNYVRGLILLRSADRVLLHAADDDFGQQIAEKAWDEWKDLGSKEASANRPLSLAPSVHWMMDSGSSSACCCLLSAAGGFAVFSAAVEPEAELPPPFLLPCCAGADDLLFWSKRSRFVQPPPPFSAADSARLRFEHSSD